MKLQMLYTKQEEINIPARSGKAETGSAESCAGGSCLVLANYEIVAGFIKTEIVFSATRPTFIPCRLNTEKEGGRLVCLLQGSVNLKRVKNPDQRINTSSFVLLHDNALQFRADLMAEEELHLLILDLPEIFFQSIGVAESNVLVNEIAANSELLLMATTLNDCSYEGEKRSVFLEAKLHTFCALVIAAMCKTPPTPDMRSDNNTIQTLLSARSRLEQESEKPYTLREILKRCGLESKESRSAFRDLFGMDVTSYLPYTRLKKSFRAVIEGKETIEAIAMAAAYNNVSSFITAFNKFGFATPAALRKHYRLKSNQQAKFYIANENE